MKTFALFGVSVAMMLSALGCATPAYSPAEREQMIARNFDYNGKQAVDDIDDFLLLRPASHLTIWNVQ